MRFIAREMRASGVLAFEWAFRSLTSSFDHLRRGARFLPLALFALFALFAFIATISSLMMKSAYTLPMGSSTVVWR